MSNSPDPSRSHRFDLKERKRTVCSTLDAIGEVLLEISLAYSKMKQLTAELRNIQKSEKDMTTHPCLGYELRRMSENENVMTSWIEKSNCDFELIKECVLIRCNDTSITRVNIAFQSDYKYILGDCLTRNTCVTDLTIKLTWYHTGDRVAHKSFQSLLHYVKTSTALRRVHVQDDGDRCREKNAISLLNSIAINPYIEEIDWCARLPITELRGALVGPPTPRIKVLSTHCADWKLYPVPEQLLVPQPIANCPSLLKLRLSYSGVECTLAESTMNHLTDVATPLQVLAIEGRYGTRQLQPLANYLQVSTTLQHLELRNFHFDIENAESFLEDLRYHYSLTTASISKLSMIECRFDRQATDKFRHFFQVTRYNESNPIAALRELELSTASSSDLFYNTIATCLISQQSPHLCQSKLHDIGTEVHNPTIGSGIKVLKLRRFSFMDIKKFCETLQSNAKYISLAILQISDLGNRECLHLASCIPKLLSLQELYMDSVSCTVSTSVLLPMIQQCGNLCKVSIQDHKGLAVLNVSQSKFANAVCKRNQALLTIFSRPIKHDWRYEKDPSMHKSRQLIHSIHTMDDYGTVLLLPRLFHVAKQIPITSVSSIMKALMNVIVEGIEYV